MPNYRPFLHSNGWCQEGNFMPAFVFLSWLLGLQPELYSVENISVGKILWLTKRSFSLESKRLVDWYQKLKPYSKLVIVASEVSIEKLFSQKKLFLVWILHLLSFEYVDLSCRHSTRRNAKASSKAIAVNCKKLGLCSVGGVSNYTCCIQAQSRGKINGAAGPIKWVYFNYVIRDSFALHITITTVVKSIIIPAAVPNRTIISPTID